jgi:hypothetical protein
MIGESSALETAIARGYARRFVYATRATSPDFNKSYPLSTARGGNK